MSPRRLPFPFRFFLFLLGSAVLAACGSAVATKEYFSPGLGVNNSQFAVSAGSDSNAGERPELPLAAPAYGEGSGSPQSGSADSASSKGGQAVLPTAGAVSQAPVSGSEPGQLPLIIKQGQMRLAVKNTDVAIDRLTQIVSDTGGYIISNRIWYEQITGESYKYASYTIGVPVEEFEIALRLVRALAVKVIDETAGGQDVSEEYNDLESQLRNLKATRDRILGFLEQAKTVEESLRINQELANIEAQIEQVEGRMRFLAGRAAFSTLTIQFEPDIPPQPTPTPTATPTPTPTPTPVVWDPGNTFQQASSVAVRFGQFLVDMTIYIAVWLPFAAPILIVWLVYRTLTKKRKSPLP